MNPTAIGPARSVAHARYLSSTCCSTSPRIAVEWRARPCFWPGPREYMRPVQCSCSTKDHPTRTSSTGISAVLKVVPDSADHSTRSFDRTLAALVCVVATLASSGAAGAAIHEEPANALSIPTWLALPFPLPQIFRLFVCPTLIFTCLQDHSHFQRGGVDQCDAADVEIRRGNRQLSPSICAQSSCLHTSHCTPPNHSARVAVCCRQ